MYQKLKQDIYAALQETAEITLPMNIAFYT